MQAIHKKRGAELPPVPQSKGSRIALLVETGNAESPTQMPILFHAAVTRHGIKYEHPQGIHAALFLTNSSEFARFLDCQNQSVQ